MAEHSVRTFCRVCEPSCGLVAKVEDGEIRKLEPDRDHPVTKGFACHKGLATLDIHRDPDRLASPPQRTEHQLRAGFFLPLAHSWPVLNRLHVVDAPSDLIERDSPLSPTTVIQLSR